MDWLTTDPARLDSQAATIIECTGKPFFATPTEPQKILDIGCGTGYFTYLLAKQWPKAQVIGIDTRRVDASRHGRLPNLLYIKASLEELVEREDMLFWPGTFDYIFQRCAIFDVGEEGWKERLKVLMGLVGPDGWIELQEPSLEVYGKDGERLSAGWEWFRKLDECCEASGVDLTCERQLKDQLEEAGAKNVNEFSFKMPAGVAAEKEHSEDAHRNEVMRVSETLIDKFCSRKVSEVDLTKFKDNMRATLGRCAMDDYSCWYAISGQKHET